MPVWFDSWILLYQSRTPKEATICATFGNPSIILGLLTSDSISINSSFDFLGTTTVLGLGIHCPSADATTPHVLYCPMLDKWIKDPSALCIRPYSSPKGATPVIR